MSIAIPLDPTRSEPGFGPQWWSSGTRTWRWWTAGAIACTFVVVDAAFQLRSGIAGSQVALSLAGDLAEITVGLLFWMWRRNLIGPLILTYVVASMIPDLAAFFFPNSRVAGTLYYPGQWFWQGLWVWMLFAFPLGRIWNRASVYLVIYITVFLTLVPVVQELFRSEPRTYLYLGHGWSGLHFFTWFYGIDAVLVWAPFAVFGVIRLLRTTPGVRRRLLPLYGAGAYTCLVTVPIFSWYVLTAKSFSGEWPTDFPAWDNWVANNGTIFLVSAAGAAFGLLRVRQKRSSVADLVVELGQIEPGRVRETLARTLGDPTLELGLWLPERRVWVDEAGHQLELPDDDRRAVTYFGDYLAVMVHDRDLLDQPRLLEAVGSAGRLALENERLQAELRAQLRELQASRARIVRTADEERRRLERDLHDGAQQRLLGLGMGLNLLTDHLLDGGQELLGEVQGELDDALRELRELARGIHPAVLTDQGLDAAVRTLAQRAPLPVAVTSDGTRPPAHVETAAYFVVSEALANVAKYAHATQASVELARDNGDLRVAISDDGVGGANLGVGSGLTGLADRVGALGGGLSLDSPVGEGTRLTALIPFGGDTA
jgi:signal transduction histidine kinase